MARVFLQNIIKDKRFEDLPVNWNTFDLESFSKDKKLWDYQQEASPNVIVYKLIDRQGEHFANLTLLGRDGQTTFETTLNRAFPDKELTTKREKLLHNVTSRILDGFDKKLPEQPESSHLTPSLSGIGLSIGRQAEKFIQVVAFNTTGKLVPGEFDHLPPVAG